jgi:hypothetical protein
MRESCLRPNYLSCVTQVIGVAYTYQPSLAVRRHMTQGTSAYHSSQTSDFSYFYKGDSQSIVRDSQELYLRGDLFTGGLARHWPEPELAALLGERHEIIAYTLANDLTAISIETRGRTNEMDGTYEGKVWNRSGSLGPQFISASVIRDPSKLTIGLKIEREGRVIYDRRYSTSRRLRPFNDIPDAIVSCNKCYRESPPPSKRIKLDREGFLISGTVVMLGTGLVVSERHSCERGDFLTVYCSAIGKLRNAVTTPTPEP